MKRANGVYSSSFLALSAFVVVLLSTFAYIPLSNADEGSESSEQVSQDDAYLYATATIDSGSDTQTSLQEAQQKVLEELKQMFIDPYRPTRNQPVLERVLRQEVVSGLPAVTLPKVEFEQIAMNGVEGKANVRGRISKSAMAQALALRMVEIETQLSQYLHVGERGSRIKQLKVLLPTLPWIEEYKHLTTSLKKLNVALETDKTPVALLLDRKITILFNEFLLMLDDSVPEAVVYESDFAEALRQQGLQISAKQPDLILKYNIEKTGEYSKDHQLGFSAEIDMLEPNQVSYVSYSGNIEVGDTLTSEVEYNALQLFAKGVFEAIKNRLLEAVYQKKSLD